MKSSRGIQEHQVWAAADLLVAAGERPTIEKVRQKLGSGSPNTVSPMLDSWFKTLPGRLGVQVPTEEEAGYRMPAEVVAGVKTLWDTARKEASDLARDAVAGQRRQLDERAEALAVAEDELRRRQAAFADLQASLETALLQANETINGLERQLDAGRDRHVALEAQVEEARAALAYAQSGQERLRENHAAAMAARDQADRLRADRQDAQERRMLLEIDRAREEAKKATAAVAREAARAAEFERRLAEGKEEAVAALRAAETGALVLAKRAMEAEGALASALAQIQMRDEQLLRMREEASLPPPSSTVAASHGVRRVISRRR